MTKPSRLTSLPKTPALVRRAASIAAVASVATTLGCSQPMTEPQAPPQPPQVAPDPPQVAPQPAPPQVAPQPAQ